MDLTSIIIVLALLLITGLLILVYVRLQAMSQKQSLVDQQQATGLVNQVFGEITNKVAAQTKAILETDKQAIYKDNQDKQRAMEQMVTQLKQEIEARQAEIRSLEQDRNKKFGEITTAIKEHRQLTEQLKTTTDSLAKVLSNNQVRGAWGERIIEDMLKSAGLIEGQHYLRQTTLGDKNTKPDITLLLPNQRKVAIDVKFPYSAVQKMALAETKEAKREHLKDFSRDLRDKIKQVSGRGYISIESGTLDYAIMFVPNEMLFSFINQEFPDIVDEAMEKKVMLVSPFTFLIVARTVMESYRNFMIENNLRVIINHIGEFALEWERFTKEFSKFDDSILKLRTNFDQLVTTRYKQMDLRLSRIQKASASHQLRSGETVELKEQD